MIGLDIKTMLEVARAQPGRLWPSEAIRDLIAVVTDLQLRLESKTNALRIAIQQRNELTARAAGRSVPATGAELASELAGLLNATELSDAAKIIVLFQSACALVDRTMLHEGKGLCAVEEFEQIARGAFVLIRAATGNTSPPKGGVQA